MNEPLSIAAILQERRRAISAALATPERIAMAEATARHTAAMKRDTEMRRALEERRIPTKPETRDVVRQDTIPLTVCLATLLRALAWRQARRRPTGEAPGLLVVLAGTNGAGKTVAGCWIVARWSKSSMWLSARELAETPDSDWNTYVEERAKWFGVDLLMVDDLGAERSKAAEARIAHRFSSLVLARYEAGLATIVATNVSQGLFCGRYLATDEPRTLADGRRVHGNERLRSRLSGEQRGQGCEYWYELEGAPDFREKHNATLLSTLPRLDAQRCDVVDLAWVREPSNRRSRSGSCA